MTMYILLPEAVQGLAKGHIIFKNLINTRALTLRTDIKQFYLRKNTTENFLVRFIEHNELSLEQG